MSTFSPEQKPLSDLFNERIYAIPSYQRPYSWDCEGKNDKNNQVNAIWDDLIEAYKDAPNDIYFLGSMVVIGKLTDDYYQVVDGQQRLTTLVLLFTAVKCFVKSVTQNNKIDVKLSNKIPNLINTIDRFVFQLEDADIDEPQIKKLMIDKSDYESFDYDAYLRQSMECIPLKSVFFDKNATEEQKEIASRYFKNRDYFTEQFHLNFLHKDHLHKENYDNLIKFVKYLRTRVSVVQIRAEEFGTAHQIFEILNNRGLPLSNKDLFRNFIIREFFQSKKEKEKKNATKYWHDLDTQYNLDSDFLSRYIESKHGEKQRQSAYNVIEIIYKKDFKQNIGNLYDDIKTYLNIYTNIAKLDFNNKKIENTIESILETGNNAITVSFLMSIFKNITDEKLILDYLSLYERYVLYLEISNKKRFKAAILYEAIANLNAKKVQPLEAFTLSDAEKKEFRAALNNDFDKNSNDIARLFLARYVWYFTNEDDTVNADLVYDKCTLEHIIPQQPEQNTNWLKDFSKEFRNDFTYKLGNMTLLTQKMNSAAKNYDYSKKIMIYKKTLLTMTSSLPDVITENTIRERHNEIVNGILEDLKLL